MYEVKNSTSLAVAFFAHDVNGDAVTGIADGSWTNKRISKNGAAFAAMTVTVTEMERGFYSFTLSSSHTDTNGVLSVIFTSSTSKQVNLQWRVATLITDDLATPTNITAGTITTVTTTTNLTNLPAIPANWLTAAGINADAFTAAKFADDVSTEFANKTWDTDATGHQTTGTFGQAIGDPVADTNTIYGAVVTGAVGATIAADIITIQADTDDIQTRLPTALVSGRMDSSVGAMAANVLTATAINADAITAAKVADDVSTEIANKTWDMDATGHQTQGTFGQVIGDSVADTDSIWGLANTNLDAAVSSRMATYTQPSGFLAATFPSGTVANTTNITAGTVTTATNVTTVNGLAASIITAGSIATDAIGSAEIAASGANKIADHVLRRTYSNARQSADGDTVLFRSLLGAIGKLVNKWSISGSTLTIYQEDDTASTAPGGTQTITGTPGADPITALDTT